MTIVLGNGRDVTIGMPNGCYGAYEMAWSAWLKGDYVTDGTATGRTKAEAEYNATAAGYRVFGLRLRPRRTRSRRDVRSMPLPGQLPRAAALKPELGGVPVPRTDGWQLDRGAAGERLVPWWLKEVGNEGGCGPDTVARLRRELGGLAAFIRDPGEVRQRPSSPNPVTERGESAEGSMDRPHGGCGPDLSAAA